MRSDKPRRPPTKNRPPAAGRSASGGRGRQAEAARNDRRILDAARRVFARGGADAPIAAIAAEAGVGVASLYRRFASKDELLQHLCQAAMEESMEAAEAAVAALKAGSDAWSALVGYIRACVAFRSGAFAPVAGTFPVTEHMIDTAIRGFELDEHLVAQAHAEGSLRPDVTAVDIVELIGLFSRLFRPEPTGHEHDEDSTADRTEQRLLAIALDGLRAPGHEPLTGPPPRWQDFSAAWGPPS